MRCELGTGRWGGEKPAASKKTEWKKNRRQVGSDALLGYEILIPHLGYSIDLLYIYRLAMHWIL